ncbi:hypothetical protein PMAYCL1PPCAC_11924, partial [Pristionchus mayeri]
MVKYKLSRSPITVLTVDSAQGKESPIVIILTTCTSTSPSKFFNDQQRCTVAISRHKSALVILGKEDTVSLCNSWSTVIGGNDFTTVNSDD